VHQIVFVALVVVAPRRSRFKPPGRNRCSPKLNHSACSSRIERCLRAEAASHSCQRTVPRAVRQLLRLLPPTRQAAIRGVRNFTGRSTQLHLVGRMAPDGSWVAQTALDPKPLHLARCRPTPREVQSIRWPYLVPSCQCGRGSGIGPDASVVVPRTRQGCLQACKRDSQRKTSSRT